MAIYACSNKDCNNVFKRKPHLVRKTKNKLPFCSRKCKAIVLPPNPSKKTKTILEDRFCQICGNKIEDDKQKYTPKTWKKRKYCSKKCGAIARTKSIEHHKKMQRKKEKNKRENLSGVYVRKQIKRIYGFNSTKDIPEELVNVKKVQIALNRQIKQKLKQYHEQNKQHIQR